VLAGIVSSFDGSRNPHTKASCVYVCSCFTRSGLRLVNQVLDQIGRRHNADEYRYVDDRKRVKVVAGQQVRLVSGRPLTRTDTGCE